MAAGTAADVSRLLEDASEALHLAVVTAGGTAQGRRDQLRRAEHSRAFIVEAVVALGRARVHVPRLRTQSLPVVLACEAEPAQELLRLQGMATRLLWQNHRYLPPRKSAKPLAPEEEAQLAVWVAEATTRGRLHRAMGYRWSALALGVATAGIALQIPVIGWIAGLGGIGLALVRMLRDEPAPLVEDPA